MQPAVVFGNEALCNVPTMHLLKYLWTALNFQVIKKKKVNLLKIEQSRNQKVRKCSGSQTKAL